MPDQLMEITVPPGVGPGQMIMVQMASSGLIEAVKLGTLRTSSHYS